MDTKGCLQQLIAERGTTVIIYHGGSVPGAARGIAPIEIKGDSLIARCLETDMRKTFKLDKIHLAGADPIKPYPEAKAESAELEAMSFEDLVAAHTEQLRAKGWHVIVEENAMSVHRFFKNGKPRKGAAAGIVYSRMTYSCEFDETTEMMVDIERESTRPWGVFSEDAEGGTYGVLWHAFRSFLQRCERLSPLSAS